jgi:Zn-finger nucleic acid-binding protein
LDRGELDKIIARAIAEVPATAGPYRDDDDRGERYDYRREYKPNRKKSFLGDLFDLG